jgi:hypothetical protein
MLLYSRDQLPRMNSRDMEKFCNGLNNIMWNQRQADQLFKNATDAVHKAANGNLERDNIHTQPFTEKLLAQIRGTAKPVARIKRTRKA